MRQASIRAGDAKTLDANAEWLKANPNFLLLIEGHCDERGTEAYNLALGDRRAKSTLNYLISQGVRSDRVSMISFGGQRRSAPSVDERQAGEIHLLLAGERVGGGAALDEDSRCQE